MHINDLLFLPETLRHFFTEKVNECFYWQISSRVIPCLMRTLYSRRN